MILLFPHLAIFTLGLAEVCIVGGLVLIFFLGPRLHKSIRGVTRLPSEFLRGRREGKIAEAPPVDPKKTKKT